MSKLQKTKSEYKKTLFHSNEVKHNKRSSIAVLVLGCMGLIISALNAADAYDLISPYIRYILMANGLINVLLFAYGVRCRFDRPFLRDLIICDIMLSAGIMYFFFPTTMDFLIFGPILVSALYYDARLTGRISILCWVVYTVLTGLNVYLESTGVMTDFHQLQGLDIWESSKEVLLYRWIPQSVIMFVTASICNIISVNGKRLIAESAEDSYRSAVISAELSAASDIQQSSLPDREFSDFEGRLRIDSVMRPAKVVGGDFYDYFYLGHSIVILIADVSDKGMPAAMFMMRAKNSIRAEINAGTSLEASIQSVNNQLCGENKENMFVTLWAACINVFTGVGKYVNCGHDYPVLRHADGSIERIENVPDTVLGVFPDTAYTSYPIQLNEGDRILLFTDGFTDAVNGDKEAFGEQRLLDAITGCGGDSLCKHLLSKIDSFCGETPQYDDLTALCLSLSPADKPERLETELPADYSSVETVIDSVNRLLSAKGCPESVRQNADVVMDELCANIVDYAYSDGNGNFTVSTEVGENYLRLTLTDRGPAFDPTVAGGMPDPEELQIGGLGIGLVRNLTDRMEYERVGGTNRLSVLMIWRA